MKKNPPRLLACAAAALLALAGGPARAQDMAQNISYSAFGTLGAAVSDRDYNYQRFINSSGTVKRDSVFGAQVDAQFNPEWSGTLQLKAAPSTNADSRWALTASWAFLSWRPNNDWLVRAGKVRIPLYLFSENLDVGQSYDFARMPTEMYSIAPTTDIAGLYVTRNWSLGGGDLSLDVYSGRSPVSVRFHSRDLGTMFEKVDTRVTGTVATWRSDSVLWRAGFHHASTELNQQTPQTLVPNPLLPGAYATTYTSTISNDIFTMGVDWGLPNDWRFLAEVERDFQHKTDFGANTVGGYVSVLKTIDRWTPYVALSALRTVGAPSRDYELLTHATAPIPQLAAGYRTLADLIPYYDQHSLAIGTSYALNAHSKIKAELLHTWIGKGSVMIDSPPGGDPVSHQGINVLSLSYNFAF